MAPLLFHGAVIHSVSLRELEILTDALIVVDTSGQIVTFDKKISRQTVETILGRFGEAANDNDDTDIVARIYRILLKLGRPEAHLLSRGEFLIPGFVDTHNHAPQWAMRGLGQGLHILDWLDQVTFPSEARFADADHARAVYEDCVAGFLRQGITTASYYGSLHGEATCILADTCVRRGQRALVGKCNMDRSAPDYYRDESAVTSLHETRACIAHIRHIDPAGALVQPVLTPRFAVSCSATLLRGLGDLAAAEQPPLPVQTHFAEAEQQVAATQTLFPDFASSEAGLYDHFGLLGPRTILAHCTVITDVDKDLLRLRGCGVAHCPIANMTVGGGFMAAPVRDLLRRGIPVGLGTDSGGGFSSSMLDTVRQAFVAANAREVASGGNDKALSLAEGFHLATLGGAAVCGLAHKVGSFAIGKEFDASWIKTGDPSRGVMTMIWPEDGLETIFEKFIMTGDDRNIDRVYVRGVSVKY
ncbi:amidohydrolase [Grosmannia clavigera kw1407]|uniref:Probable guanine deaminase n=1 Tax=Grosmannia clavigera (strain kw1407 / UAMH 11150) TaxID=655863 RepID=F0XBJ5_GROCL|nr:amidohydrolase [Grosmannia clavigera kw1407]EFX04869.1 amidohydrolase [Grosmannia clavigera kw1407]